MKCPKCHYVSFEPEPRCRHCGYGFSLADADRAAALADAEDSRGTGESAAAADELFRARSAAPPQPFVRPARAETSVVAGASGARRSSGGGVAGVADDPRAAGASPPAEPWEPELLRTPPPAATTELPLFVRAVSASMNAAAPGGFDSLHDEPLVRVPVEPRAPLSVRRAAPEASLHRTEPPPRLAPRKLGPLDRDLLEDLQRIELAELSARAKAKGQLELAAGRVGAGIRLAAAALDALVISGLSAAVFWITLRWCDLPIEQALTLPLLPTAAFHALVSLGYLLMFTAAGGQTIGKMAFGLRVVGDTAGRIDFPALTLSQAAYRVMLSLPSVLALGVGFLPALVGSERAFHDRLAHTRVVRA